jgi:hypothetical protein
MIPLPLLTPLPLLGHGAGRRRGGVQDPVERPATRGS